MKVGLFLEDREAADRRDFFRQKIKSGAWYSCVASVDSRYYIPIIFEKTQRRYRTSLPNQVRDQIKPKALKSFPSVCIEAEKMIMQSAAARGENRPLMTIFRPDDEKRVKWTRTGNLYCLEKPDTGVQVTRFRPVQIGWGPLIRHLTKMNLPAAAKIVLLYAWLRGFQSGEFWASSTTTANDTRIHPNHVKRIFMHLHKLRHFERLKREGKGHWRFGFLATKDDLQCGNFKLPQKSEGRTSSGNLKVPSAATLGSKSGNPKLHKAEKTLNKEARAPALLKTQRARYESLLKSSEVKFDSENRRSVEDRNKSKTSAQTESASC